MAFLSVNAQPAKAVDSPPQPATNPTPPLGNSSRRATRSPGATRLRNAWRDSTLSGYARPDLGTLNEFSPAHLAAAHHDWQLWARDDQLPPAPDDPDHPWRAWVILGGRGAGKTRAGAEWVRAMALGIAPFATEPASRIALVGETLNDVRRVMIEGVSGLLSVHRDDERPHFESSKLQLTWPNGTVAQMFSAENPDSLRGPQFAAAWCDELAKWRTPETTWDMLQFGLRLGTNPQVAVTTTPRPIPLLKALLADAATVLTRSSTIDNAKNLSPGFIAEITRRYAGTVLGRQELMGEIIDDISGSLWRREWIANHRVASRPDLAHVVVAVDPPVTSTAASDACGIVVAGISEAGHAYVIADRTVQGREPHAWARAVIATYREFLADRVVAEVNQGGDLVVSVLRQIDAAVAVRKVHATRGKWLRAEPIAALYAEGRVSHVGTYDILEDQMCLFGTGGLPSGRSPDRLDALVPAMSSSFAGAMGVRRSTPPFLPVAARCCTPPRAAVRRKSNTAAGGNATLLVPSHFQERNANGNLGSCCRRRRRRQRAAARGLQRTRRDLDRRRDRLADRRVRGLIH